MVNGSVKKVIGLHNPKQHCSCINRKEVLENTVNFAIGRSHMHRKRAGSQRKFGQLQPELKCKPQRQIFNNLSKDIYSSLLKY
jgi:hypothetical protein